MKRIQYTLSVLLVVALATGVAGCFDPFSYGPRGGGGSVPDVVSYEGDVYPILLSRCSTCHSAGGVAEQTTFVLSNEPATDYQMVAGFVAATADQSPLLQKAAGQTAHGGSNTITESSVEFRTVAAWVEQGAAND